MHCCLLPVLCLGVRADYVEHVGTCEQNMWGRLCPAHYLPCLRPFCGVFDRFAQIPRGISQEQIRSICAPYGEIVDANVMPPKRDNAMGESSSRRSSRLGTTAVIPYLSYSQDSVADIAWRACAVLSVPPGAPHCDCRLRFCDLQHLGSDRSSNGGIERHLYIPWGRSAHHGQAGRCKATGHAARGSQARHDGHDGGRRWVCDSWGGGGP
jgi:hypothetical protein